VSIFVVHEVVVVRDGNSVVSVRSDIVVVVVILCGSTYEEGVCWCGVRGGARSGGEGGCKDPPRPVCAVV
jgi:hypothetical protein